MRIIGYPWYRMYAFRVDYKHTVNVVQLESFFSEQEQQLSKIFAIANMYTEATGL